MILCIDRFEGDVAVCEREDGSFCRLPRRDLPADASEGDVLVPDGAGYRVDRDETARRRAHAHALEQRLLHRHTPD